MSEYFQCHLEQKTDNGTIMDVAWLEGKHPVGSRVSLKGAEGIWTITTIDPIGIDAKALREKQAADRRSLPSLEDRGAAIVAEIQKVIRE